MLDQPVTYVDLLLPKRFIVAYAYFSVIQAFFQITKFALILTLLNSLLVKGPSHEEGKGKKKEALLYTPLQVLHDE